MSWSSSPTKIGTAKKRARQVEKEELRQRIQSELRPTLKTQNAHTGNRTPVTSMEGLYDATTLCVLVRPRPLTEAI